MFWYLILCFATPDDDWICRKLQAPDKPACEYVMQGLRRYATINNLKVEIDCIESKEYV